MVYMAARIDKKDGCCCLGTVHHTEVVIESAFVGNSQFSLSQASDRPAPYLLGGYATDPLCRPTVRRTSLSANAG